MSGGLHAIAHRLGWVLVFALAACSGDATTPRCAGCGMLVASDSGWRAGARDASGAELAFDAPKCLFRYQLAHPGTEDAWVIEYYGQTRQRADEVLYVIGSDLEGPMGPDLVPVRDRAEAERLLTDHRGDAILEVADVDRARVDGLFVH
ncbi:MAG: nitrous oxide reductase accessory protein NosL [Sandaracinaceae bacterium]